MKMPAAAVALAVFVVAATACMPSAEQEPAAGEAASAPPDVQALEETIRAHWDAINTQDGETVTGHHLPRFTGFLADEGPLWVLESEEDQSAIEEALGNSESDWRPRDFSVDLYGDVAVAAFYIDGSVTWPDGSVLEGPRRVSAVWVWDGGAWKEAHHHDSPLVTAPEE